MGKVPGIFMCLIWNGVRTCVSIDAQGGEVYFLVVTEAVSYALWRL